MNRALRNADDAVADVFEGIKIAATLIEAVDPAAILESWNRQETILPILDPTGYRAILAARDDMRRKKQIIEAADRFLREWNRIKQEALSADETMLKGRL